MSDSDAHGQALDTLTLQAEAADLIAAPIETLPTGFRGAGTVNFAASGSVASWSHLEGGPGGGVNISIRYALGGSVVREGALSVNGIAQRVAFAPTASTWASVSVFARLNAGKFNTLVLSSDGQDFGTIDEVSLSQPAPVKVPTRVFWGGYQGMEQLVGTGASQWRFVQQNQDGLLLHGAYWGDTTQSPSPALIGPQLSVLLAPYSPHYIYEFGFPGVYPHINSALGTNAVSSAVAKLNAMVGYGFSRPDISTDYHMYAWQESARYHPEWSEKDFFTALCGNWENYTGTNFNAAGADRSTYGWFRQFVEGVAATFPDVRITATDSPVYFNWDDKLELGDGDNTWYAWLKLERHGTNIEGFWSSTGESWKSLGTATLPAGAVQAGLALSSQNNARLGTGKFTSPQVWDFFFQDIGTPGRGGDLAYGSGVYTLTSYGDESTRNGSKDNHFLAYKDWSGDGTFIARVDNLAGSNATRTWPLAGIEMRESTLNNARFVSAWVNAGNEAHLQSRSTAGATLTNVLTQATVGAPQWLKLERVGNVFTASRSVDGTLWTTMGSTTLALNASLKVGLVADSQVYFESVVAKFSNVNFLSGTAAGASWTSSDVGSPGVPGATTIASPLQIDASGLGIGGGSDSFRWVEKALSADGTVLTKCSYFADKTTPATALNAEAKMGVMVRSAASANAANISLSFTPGNGLELNSRASAGGATALAARWQDGETRIISKYRPVMHYFSGNAFMAALRDSFPGAYKKNWAGFTSDSPYSGYMKWGGSETYVDAIAHRQKIRDYEAFLQAAGTEHQLIANDNTGGATGTQAERDTWDTTYTNNSLRSVQLHQIEGGRPDKVLFESWYDGPYSLVPETKAGSFTNLAMTGIKYLKGVGQTLDLSLKRSAETAFYGGALQQSVPAGEQARQWRASGGTASETFTVRLTNKGEVDALPVLQAFESGGTGWTLTYRVGATDIGAALKSADGFVITDSATRGQELVAPGASVDLTIAVTATSPATGRSVLIRAFWNPQDPTLAVKDSVLLELLPPNAVPLASTGFLSTAPGTSLDLDLWSLASDAESPEAALWFELGAVGNGTAVLLADGHTVHFTPAAGYNGPATIAYTVRDALSDPRLLRSYTFETPDTAADSLATDAANRGVGVLSNQGTGAFAYEAGAPGVFGSTQSQCLKLSEPSGLNDAKLAVKLPASEYNLTTGSWTTSLWFKRASTNTVDLLFYIGSGNALGGDGHELELYAVSNGIKASYWDAGNVQLANLASPLTVPVNTWHHAALSWNATGTGTGTLTLYLDGVACGNATFAASFKQGNDLVFGGATSSASDARALNGWLDDCAIFSEALSAGEIANLARMPVASNAGAAVSATVTINVDDSRAGLLGRWPFEGNLSDVSGNGWHLTATGGAAPIAALKQQGAQSLSLSGTGSSVLTAAAVPLGGALTVSAWVYVPSGSSQIQSLAANSLGGGTANGFRFYVNGYNTGDGKLVLETGNGTTGGSISSAAGTVVFDRWQHVAASINRTAGIALLYRNGVLVASGSCSTDFGNSSVLNFGAMATAGFPLKGNLDDVRIYSRALSAAEIGTLINATNQPPSIGAIPDQTLVEGAGSGALPLVIGDAETAPQFLTLSAVSGNPALVSGVVFGGSGANRTVSLAPVANQLGSTSVTISVSDGTLSSSDTVAVTVTGTPLATWRFQNFGTTANTGLGANNADSDRDGWNNLMEFALNGNPGKASMAPAPVLGREGQSLTLTYWRTKAALAESVTFSVQSATSLSGPWSAVGEQILIETATLQQVKAIGPVGGSFLRLRVNGP